MLVANSTFFNGSFETSANLNIDPGCIGNHRRMKNNMKSTSATYMKFTLTKSSVRFSSFKLNMVQHVEVKMDETGLVKIKVNDQEKEMIDKVIRDLCSSIFKSNRI